jgi:hypothetical protein
VTFAEIMAKPFLLNMMGGQFSEHARTCVLAILQSLVLE